MNDSIFVWEGPDKSIVASDECPFHLAKAGEEIEVGHYKKADTLFIQAPVRMVNKDSRANEILREAKCRWAADTGGRQQEPKLSV